MIIDVHCHIGDRSMTVGDMGEMLQSANPLFGDREAVLKGFEKPVGLHDVMTRLMEPIVGEGRSVSW